MIETSAVDVAAFQEAWPEGPAWRSTTEGAPSGDNTHNHGSENTITSAQERPHENEILTIASLCRRCIPRHGLQTAGDRIRSNV